jgi:glutathione peroxidase
MSRLITLTLIIFTFCTLNSTYAQKDKMANTLYSIEIDSLMGGSIDLSNYSGKKILFVNVASKCGFTPQYEELQALHEKYGEKVVIIGVPCNQFLNQEPGESSEIAEFCQKNYGVTFLITEKVDVKGKNQHHLYRWLTTQKENGVLDSKVEWNFQKYLIDEEGNLIKTFSPKTKPLSNEIIEAILD